MVDTAAAQQMEELEEALLLLGREELETDVAVAELLKVSRKAGLEGDYVRSDDAWDAYQRLKAAKAKLMERIFEIEKALYRLRREVW